MAFLFEEGAGPYTVTVGVINASTKAGQPWPATLTMKILVQGAQVYVSDSRTVVYAAGERKEFSYQFSIPLGDVADGAIQVTILDPDGVQIDAAQAGFTVAEVPIDYGADVDIS